MPRRYSKKKKRGAPEIPKTEEVCEESPLILMEDMGDQGKPQKQYSKKKPKKKSSSIASAEKPLWSANPANKRRIEELKPKFLIP
jgi:hypothetical protein